MEAFWRIGSWNRRNVELAFQAGEWGRAKTDALAQIEVGDRLVFYVTRSPNMGYWGLGTVTRELFTSQEKIWLDGDYPFRISFKPDVPLLNERVPVETVKEKLPNGAFRYFRPRSVIRLDQREFAPIEKLIMRVARSAVAER
jgi:hypothetical protein